MAYLTKKQIDDMGFKYVGKEVKISQDARIYNPEIIEIGDYSRIDDFCIISGKVSIGRYNHITPMCLIAGGLPGITFGDFCTLAYGAKVFAQSDDYSGQTMVNSLIPKKFKNELHAAVSIQRHVIIGTNSVVFPGVTIAEGCSIGAVTLITKSTESWGIYIGAPAKKLKNRSRKLLELETRFLNEVCNDSL